jgi:hypothetical protein
MGIKKNQLGTVLGQETTPVNLAEQPAPASISNKVRLYSKDVSGIAELFVRDDVGNEIQITNGGNASGGKMPFVIFDTPGTYPAVMNSVNVITVPYTGLTLPASPAVNTRFGVMQSAGAPAIPVNLDAGSNFIIDPVTNIPGNTISFNYSLGGGYVEFQCIYFMSMFIWIPLAKGYCGTILRMQEESIDVDNFMHTLNVTGNATLDVTDGLATLDIGTSIRDQLVVDETGAIIKMTPGIAALVPLAPGRYAIMLNTPITIHGAGPYLYTCDEHLNLTIIDPDWGGGAPPPSIPSVQIISPGEIDITIWIWNGTFEPAMLPWTFAIFIDP